MTWVEYSDYAEMKVGGFTLAVGHDDFGVWHWSIFVDDVFGGDAQIAVGTAQTGDAARGACRAKFLLILAAASTALSQP